VDFLVTRGRTDRFAVIVEGRLIFRDDRIATVVDGQLTLRFRNAGFGARRGVKFNFPRKRGAVKLRPRLLPSADPTKARVQVICGTCGAKFEVTAFNLKRRLAQKKSHGITDEKLYCSKSCGASVVGHKRKRKPRPRETSDQTYWEDVLVKAGLGENSGLESHIRYTADIEVKVSTFLLRRLGYRIEHRPKE
jgi:hypothetical protein